MSEHPIGTIDDARCMIRWLARRRNLTVNAAIKAAGLQSKALGSFATANTNARQRTQDSTLSPILNLLATYDHLLAARPAGGQHPVMPVPGGLPLQVRAAGGEPLEIALEKLDDVRTLINTLAAANNASPSALCHQAGLSLGLVAFARGTGSQKDILLGPLIELTRAGKFELFVKPRFANQRAARFADKPTGLPVSEEQAR